MTAVDLVILTWNDDPTMLDRAVGSAVAQIECDVRVWVVDNGSAPPAAVHGDRVTLVRREENLGVGGGRNLGARIGEAPFVCFLDSDARLHEGALARCWRRCSRTRRWASRLRCSPVSDPRPPAAGHRRCGARCCAGLNRTDVYERPRASGDRRSLGGRLRHRRVPGVPHARRSTRSTASTTVRRSVRKTSTSACASGEAGWRVLQVADAGCDHPPRRAFKGLTSARGLRHSAAVVRHLWRHRARVT